MSDGSKTDGLGFNSGSNVDGFPSNVPINDRGTAQQVADNLSFQHNWKNIEIFQIPGYNSNYPIYLCIGVPSEKLHPDDKTIEREIVLVTKLKGKFTISLWTHVFDELKKHFGLEEPPRRVTMAMVTDDSTIVYYFVNKGLIKPKKN
jgi:tRNA-splicing endonuclease subunit Sen15, fungi type